MSEEAVTTDLNDPPASPALGALLSRRRREETPEARLAIARAECEKMREAMAAAVTHASLILRENMGWEQAFEHVSIQYEVAIMEGPALHIPGEVDFLEALLDELRDYARCLIEAYPDRRQRTFFVVQNDTVPENRVDEDDDSDDTGLLETLLSDLDQKTLAARRANLAADTTPPACDGVSPDFVPTWPKAQVTMETRLSCVASDLGRIQRRLDVVVNSSGATESLFQEGIEELKDISYIVGEVMEEVENLLPEEPEPEDTEALFL